MELRGEASPKMERFLSVRQKLDVIVDPAFSQLAQKEFAVVLVILDNNDANN